MVQDETRQNETNQSNGKKPKQNQWKTNKPTQSASAERRLSQTRKIKERGCARMTDAWRVYRTAYTVRNRLFIVWCVVVWCRRRHGRRTLAGNQARAEETTVPYESTSWSRPTSVARICVCVCLCDALGQGNHVRSIPLVVLLDYPRPVTLLHMSSSSCTPTFGLRPFLYRPASMVFFHLFPVTATYCMWNEMNVIYIIQYTLQYMCECSGEKRRTLKTLSILKRFFEDAIINDSFVRELRKRYRVCLCVRRWGYDLRPEGGSPLQLAMGRLNSAQLMNSSRINEWIQVIIVAAQVEWLFFHI